MVEVSLSQNVAEARERNATLMKTLVERRTDHAYPLFIQSLRDVGQHTVADLLTDIGEKTRILTQCTYWCRYHLSWKLSERKCSYQLILHSLVM